jgi:hypothetical protein
MILRLFPFAVAGSSITCNADPSAVAEDTPFQSIVFRGDSITVTLTANANWMVISDGSEARKTLSNESFSLEAGSTLRLFEHHSGYDHSQIQANTGT